MGNKAETFESRPALNYADPALNRQDRGLRSDGTAGQGWRRLGFGAGLGIILSCYAYAEHPSKEDVVFGAGVGGFLFGAAIPAVQPRRTIDQR